MDYDPMNIDFHPPIDLEYIRFLPQHIQEELEQNHIAEFDPVLVDAFFGLDVLYGALASRPVTAISLAYNGCLAALTWETEDPIIEEAMIIRGWNPVDIIGFVRNQFGHLLCWGFASTDLLSAGCVLHGWEDEYCEFCPLHLCLCCNPTLIGKDLNARDGHVCYAYSFLYGLQYIRVLGVPRVGIDRAGSVFNCSEIPPLAPFGEASSISERVSEVRTIETLEEALQELKSHPVGCFVLCYPELFTPYEHFIGPRRGRSGIPVHPVTYHAAIMISVVYYQGKWYALCKMSNGTDVGFDGYAMVSLSTMYIFAGSDIGNRGIMRSTRKPMRLLSDFVVLDMHDKRKDEKKPIHKNEENDPEEGKLKEPVSVAGLYMVGSSSSSSSVSGPGTSSSSSMSGPGTSSSSSMSGPVSTSSSMSGPGSTSSSSSLSVSVAGPICISSAAVSVSVGDLVSTSSSSSVSVSVAGPICISSAAVSVSVGDPVSTSSSVFVAGPGSSFDSLDCKLVDPEIESTVNKQMKNEMDVFSEEAVIPGASREDPIRMGGECAFDVADSLENESKGEEKELNKESG